MSADPMKLVKFVCVATVHAAGRSDSSLTIHEGVWAFCPMGGEQKGHEWRPSDGLPLTDVLRFTPRQYPSAPEPAPAARSPKPASPAASRRKATPR